MEVTILTNERGDFELHLGGCGDIAKSSRRYPDRVETFEGADLVAALVAVDTDAASWFGEEPYTQSARDNGCWSVTNGIDPSPLDRQGGQDRGQHVRRGRTAVRRRGDRRRPRERRNPRFHVRPGDGRVRRVRAMTRKRRAEVTFIERPFDGRGLPGWTARIVNVADARDEAAGGRRVPLHGPDRLRTAVRLDRGLWRGHAGGRTVPLHVRDQGEHSGGRRYGAAPTVTAASRRSPHGRAAATTTRRSDGRTRLGDRRREDEVGLDRHAGGADFDDPARAVGALRGVPPHADRDVGGLVVGSET